MHISESLINDNYQKFRYAHFTAKIFEIFKFRNSLHCEMNCNYYIFFPVHRQLLFARILSIYYDLFIIVQSEHADPPSEQMLRQVITPHNCTNIAESVEKKNFRRVFHIVKI